MYELVRSTLVRLRLLSTNDNYWDLWTRAVDSTTFIYCVSISIFQHPSIIRRIHQLEIEANVSLQMLQPVVCHHFAGCSTDYCC